MKKVKFSKSERHTAYQALGSWKAYNASKLGEAVYEEFDLLKKNIKKAENLIEKLKSS